MDLKEISSSVGLSILPNNKVDAALPKNAKG